MAAATLVINHKPLTVVHNLAGVVDKADQLALIYKIVVLIYIEHQEDHLLTAAQVAQLVHHGVVLAATALNN